MKGFLVGVAAAIAVSAWTVGIVGLSPVQTTSAPATKPRPLISAHQPAAQAGQPPTHLDDGIRVKVNLVNVFLSVNDASGAPVGGLQKRDFVLSENGHPETIRVFERDSSLPLSIALAIDTSLSVHKDLVLEKQAAHEFVHTLVRPADQLDLLAFAGDVTEYVPFTSDLHRIDRAIDRLNGIGPTALYDAIYLAAQKLETHSGRKVIVVVSDGDNSMPGVDYEAARKAALQSQAMIESIIIVPIAASAGRDTGGEHALIQLSSDTGGKYFYVQQPGELAAAFRKVSEDLRAEYLLGYYPAAIKSDSDFRRIHVALTNPGLNAEYSLHYRTGYYAIVAP